MVGGNEVVDTIIDVGEIVVVSGPAPGVELIGRVTCGD